MAKVVSINISKIKGVVKTLIGEGLFLEHFGIKDDGHGGNWHRQVSLLAQESIDKMRKTIPELKPGDFAENITTEGIVLYELPIGTVLKVGDVVLKVTQIGKECHSDCAIKAQVGKCVMPKEGIFATVEKGGMIREGDHVEIVER